MTQEQEEQAKILRALAKMGVAYTVTVIHCPSCEILTRLMAPTLGSAKWLEGASIQDAMPDMPATQRETLISGLCFRCQKEIFSSPEDETAAILADPETMEAIREAQAE